MVPTDNGQYNAYCETQNIGNTTNISGVSTVLQKKTNEKHDG